MSTGNFNLAINDLKEKTHRTFYTVKNKQFPFKFESSIEAIALYGSGVSSHTITNNCDKYSLEILHTEFCKSTLKVYTYTTMHAGQN